MSRIRIRLNSRGVTELMKSEDMQKICKAQADAAVAKCGAGYKSDTYVGKSRVNCAVYAATAKARRDNAENNTLWKALSR